MWIARWKGVMPIQTKAQQTTCIINCPPLRCITMVQIEQQWTQNEFIKVTAKKNNRQQWQTSNWTAAGMQPQHQNKTFWGFKHPFFRMSALGLNPTFLTLAEGRLSAEKWIFFYRFAPLFCLENDPFLFVKSLTNFAMLIFRIQMRGMHLKTMCKKLKSTRLPSRWAHDRPPVPLPGKKHRTCWNKAAIRYLL